MKSTEYQQLLNSVSRSMVRVKNPQRLLKLITRLINRAAHLDHTSMVILDSTRSTYTFVDSKGERRLPVSLIRLDQDNALIRWFQSPRKELGNGKDYLMYEDVLQISSNGSGRADTEARLLFAKIKEQMDLFRAEACVPSYFKGDLLGILFLGSKQDQSGFVVDELDLFQTLANDASMAIKMAQYHADLRARNAELERNIQEVNRLVDKDRATYYQIILSLACEVNARDAYTSGHMKEVERLGVMTAEEMGLDMTGRRRDVLVASLHLHDVGKIGIPENILKKEGRLTEEEWSLMRQHPIKGAKILEPLDDFKEVARIVMLHHESYDGSGYPYGLQKESIPLEARIIAVVDAFHAMVSTRCYRRKKSFEYAIGELTRGAGTQFDPVVVEAFVKAINKRVLPEYHDATGREAASV